MNDTYTLLDFYRLYIWPGQCQQMELEWQWLRIRLQQQARRTAA